MNNKEPVQNQNPIPRHHATLFQPMPEPPHLAHHKHKRHASNVTTTVNVTVNEKEEGELSGCFKSLFSCGRKSK